MYKLVLCLFVAAAVADPEPGAVIAPYGQLAYSSWLSPATTTITKSASSVVHPSPYLYSAPYYGHFIKKREASPGTFYANNYLTPTTYFPGAYAAPALAAPLLPSSPVWSANYAYSAPAHFIKKRSAPFAFPSTYIAPTTYAAATTPVLTSTYAAASPVYSSPLFTSPYGYSHFIKKRSAPFAFPSTYIAPASYAAAAPLLTSTYTAGTPIISASPYIGAAPYAYSTYIKK